MNHREHPQPGVLLRFLRGEAAGAEKSAIVRHLLTGCPECVAVTQPFWRLAERKLEPLPLNKRKGGKAGGNPVLEGLESWK